MSAPISPLEYANEEYEEDDDSFGDDDGDIIFRVGDVVRTAQGKLAVVRYKGDVSGLSEDPHDLMLGLEILLQHGERGQGHDGSWKGQNYFKTNAHRTGVFVAPNEATKLSPEELANLVRRTREENDKMLKRVRTLEKKAAVRSRGARSTPSTPTASSGEDRAEITRLRRENAKLEEELDRAKRFKSPERSYEGDLRVVEDKLTRAKAHIKQLELKEKKALANRSAESERLRQQNTHLKHQNDRLKRDRISLRQRNSELEKQLDAARGKSGPRSRRNSQQMETLEAQVHKLKNEVAQTKAHARDRDAENEELSRQLKRVETVAHIQVRKREREQTEEHEMEVNRMKLELRQLRMENKRLKRQRDEIEELSRRTKAHQRKQLNHARRERDQIQQQQRRRRRAEIGESSDALQVQLDKVRDRLKKKDFNLSSRLTQIQTLSEHIHTLEMRLNDVNRRASVTRRVDANMLEEYSSIEEKFDQVLGELDEHAEALHSGGLSTSADGRTPQEVVVENGMLEIQLRQAREENKALEIEIMELKRQLELSSNERIEELQEEIRVLSVRPDGDNQAVELEEEKTGDEYLMSGNIARLLDRGPLSPDEVDKLREHLRVLRERFGALVESERSLSPQNLREARSELERVQNERRQNFGTEIDETREMAINLKDRHDELNSFRITAEADFQTNPGMIDMEVLEDRRASTQDLRFDVDEAFRGTDKDLEEAEFRIAEVRKLNLQVQQAVDIFAMQAGNDDVSDELVNLSNETQRMEETAEELLLKCRESRMTLVHTSMNAADTENALRALESGKPLNDESVFEAVMTKRVESLTLVSEAPAIHLSGLTEFDAPELITEAIEAIRTFKGDVQQQWDSSYELDDDAYNRKMGDLNKLEAAYKSIVEQQVGRMPQLPDGRTLFPEQVPSPFALQVLQTLEDAFNEFENEQIVQHHTYEFKRDVDEYKDRLDVLEPKIEDPMYAPRKYFDEEDDQRPRAYYEALTPIDKQLAEARQYMQYKRKGMEYKQYRSLPMQHRRLDRIEEIVSSFRDSSTEMVKDRLEEYQSRLENARQGIDDDSALLETRGMEVEQILERVNSMIERRMNLEQIQRSPDAVLTVDVTEIFETPPQHTLADLQHQLESLHVALDVNNEFVARAREDLRDIGEHVEKFEAEVHNSDVEGGRASEIHFELDDCHDLLNLHERSLNDKAKETQSHGQSLFEISNELQKHEAVSKIQQNGEEAAQDEDALIPLRDAFTDVRALYEENERALNENQLNALTYANSVYKLKQFLRDSFNAPMLPEEELQEMRIHQVKKHYQDPITQEMSNLTRFDSEEDLRNAIARIDAMRAFLDPNVADGLTGDLDQHLELTIEDLAGLRQFYDELLQEKQTNPQFVPEDYELAARYDTPVAKHIATNTDQYSSVEDIEQAENETSVKIEELSDIRQTLRAIRELRQLRAAYTSMVGPVGKDAQDWYGSHFETEIARLLARVNVNDEQELEQQLMEIDQCLDWLEAKESGNLERLDAGLVRRELVDLNPSDMPAAKAELEELKDVLGKEWRAKNAEKNLRFMNARLVLHQRSRTVIETGFEDVRTIMSVSGDGTQKIDQDRLETRHARQYSNMSSMDGLDNVVATIHKIDEEIDERRKDVLPETYELCNTMLTHRGLENAGQEGMTDIAQISGLSHHRKATLGKELEELRDEYVTYYRRRLSPEKQVELLEEQLAASKRQKEQLEGRLDPNGPRADTEVAGLIQPEVNEFVASNLIMNRRAFTADEKDSEYNPFENENRDLREQLDDSQRELEDLRKQLSARMPGETWEEDEKQQYPAGAARPQTRTSSVFDYPGPGFTQTEIMSPLTFKPVLGDGRDDGGRRRSSIMSDQRERFDRPDIGKAIVRGNFFKKKVYFQVKVPGEDKHVERSLKHFQQLRSILESFFEAQGETMRFTVPTVIQAPPAALWKSGMLTQAKIDLKNFLLDCCREKEIRRHQAYRSFVSDEIGDWKKYVHLLSKKE